MQVYMFKNKASGKIYYGISRDAHKRRYAHVYAVKHGVKTPFYDAVRAYGWEAFEFEILHNDISEAEAASIEIELINSAKEQNMCYNLHLGGHIGFDVRTKGQQSVEEWRKKMSIARKGKQPAKGMKHTEENKKLFGQYGKLRWDIYGRYPEEVLDLSFKEANEKYGISKTHYYRLRKARALSNEQR